MTVRTGWTRKSFGDAARTRVSGRPRGAFIAHLARELDLTSDRIVWMDQVHGTSIRIIRRPPPGGVLKSTDGCITALSGIALCVRSADCLPILLYDTNARVVGALHAGWRGLLGGIGMKGVREMCRVAKCRPAKIHAVFGPSIEQSCYEVGEEIRAQFIEKYGMQIQRFFRKNGKSFKMSLMGIAIRQLKNAGIPPEQIRPCRLCTACDSEDYFSFRARGDTGRIAAFVYN